MFSKNQHESRTELKLDTDYNIGNIMMDVAGNTPSQTTFFYDRDVK